MKQAPVPYSIDKSWMRRSFDRASATYDAAAVLQNEVRGLLLNRLDLIDLAPRRVVDVGAGTGHGSRALKRRYRRAQVIALDCSLGMLRAARRQHTWRRPFARLCADAEYLPLPDGSVDLIISNFALPWTDPDAVFAEFRRVLAPRGFLTFTTLGPDTLRELRAAWRQTERATPGAQDGPLTGTLRFLDMHDVGDALVRSGFADPVLDVERYTLTYGDVHRLAADLKAMGTRNAVTGRSKGLTGRGRFAAMQAAYEAYRIDGRLPVTCEVVFGQAWAPRAALGPANEGTRVSLDEVKRQLRLRRRA